MSLTWPKLGLVGEWTYGEDGWNDELNALIKKLDLLSALGTLGFNVTPPVSGSNGDTYVDTSGNIQVWANGVWNAYTPKNGWLAVNIPDGKLYFYSETTSSWVDFSSSTPLSATQVRNAIDSAPNTFAATQTEVNNGTVVEKYVKPNTLQTLLDTRVSTIKFGSGAPVAAPVNGEVPFYLDIASTPYDFYLWNENALAWVNIESLLNLSSLVNTEVTTQVSALTLNSFNSVGCAANLINTNAVMTYNTATFTAAQWVLGRSLAIPAGPIAWDFENPIWITNMITANNPAASVFTFPLNGLYSISFNFRWVHTIFTGTPVMASRVVGRLSSGLSTSFFGSEFITHPNAGAHVCVLDKTFKHKIAAGTTLQMEFDGSRISGTGTGSWSFPGNTSPLAYVSIAFLGKY